jgi:hypothetical protein
MRGESALWSVAVITACVALVAVSVVAIWVAQRGGHIDVADEALTGVARTARAWASAAAAVPEVQAEGVDGGAPESAADAGAEIVDAGDDGGADEADAGDEEAETETEADAGAPDAAATTKVPAKKKKPIKKPRRR